MKKKLNIDQVTNELRGGSAFFPSYKKPSSPTPPENTDQQNREEKDETEKGALSTPKQARPKVVKTLLHPTDTVTPRLHDTVIPRYHDTTTPDNADIFEIVRRAVKHIGKEAATHRFTIEEKNHLADIEYTYKRQGIKTSENEITRIAINYFVEDYRKNGEESLLAKIIKRVNS